MMPDKRAIRDASKFASLSEQILQGMVPGAKPSSAPAPTPTPSRPTSLDIKRIQVPDSLIESIVGIKNKKVEEEVQVSEQVVAETKIESLVKRLSALLEEAKQLMSEETFAGQLAIGPGKNPKRTQVNKLRRAKR